MMDTIPAGLWGAGLTIAGIWLVTVITPGPNFLATVHASIVQSRRAGMLVACGIAAGTAVWATASLVGLGVLFRNAAWLYQAVKWAGAVYLVVVGVAMILQARKGIRSNLSAPKALTDRGAFRRGVLVDLSNPKAAAFFTSLFAVTVPPDAPLWFDVGIVALVVAVAGGWYAVVGLAVGWPPVAAAYRRAQRGLTALAGAVFVGFGVKLATDR